MRLFMLLHPKKNWVVETHVFCFSIYSPKDPCMVYLPTWLVDSYGKRGCIGSIPMDPSFSGYCFRLEFALEVFQDDQIRSVYYTDNVAAICQLGCPHRCKNRMFVFDFLVCCLKCAYVFVDIDIEYLHNKYNVYIHCIHTVQCFCSIYFNRTW